MNVKQKLSILFFLKRKKTTQDGKIPIYVRITIDGLEDEISLSEKVFSEHWVSKEKKKEVSSDDPDSEKINKKMRLTQTDLERHFDLIQAKNGLDTPAQVKQSYFSPICGRKMRTDRHKNTLFCKSLDDLIDRSRRYRRTF